MMEEPLSNLINQNKQFILFLVGIPASGKSTYSKKLCKDYPKLKRINKDDIRKMLNKPFSHEFEKIVLTKERNEGLSFLENGFSLVVDDTNIKEKHFKYWLNISKIFKIPIKVKVFEISLEEAIERDRSRGDSVGQEVINNMFELIKKEKWITNLRENYLEF